MIHMTLGHFEIGLTVAAVSLLVSTTIVRWKSVRQWWLRRQHPHDPHGLPALVARLLAAITECADRRQLYMTLLRFFCELPGTEHGSLLVHSAEQRRLVLRETLGVKPGSFQVGDLTIFLRWLAERRHPVTRDQLVNDPSCADVKSVGLQFCVQFHAELCIPCFLGEQLLAIITLGNRDDGLDYDDALLARLELLAGQCAVAIHNVDLYEDLAKQHAALKQIGELKSHLLANLSHELRTPISGVIGLADHLLETGAAADPDEQTRCLTMIREVGERLLKTVTALMDLAKLENDPRELDVRRVNVSRLVNEVCAQVKPSNAIELHADLGDTLPSVYGDANWIRRVLEHLLDNALKFTPKGRIWIEARRAGDMLTIGVHDTGIGIPKEKQEAIFTEFVQASQGAARTHEGAGVGLAIARKVVQIHGGRMWVQSEPGRGCHIFFTLPIKPAAIPTRPHAY